MNEQRIPLQDMLQLIAEDLGKIQVPAELANDIARPIWNNIQQIRKCIDALNAQPPEEKESEASADV